MGRLLNRIFHVGVLSGGGLGGFSFQVAFLLLTCCTMAIFLCKIRVRGGCLFWSAGGFPFRIRALWDFLGRHVGTIILWLCASRQG